MMKKSIAVGDPLSSYCLKEKKPCIVWVKYYFSDCLCNLRDEISFGFGLISLLCWAVAEIPQIITNFKTKSSHGVSLTFLLAWVAGDIFNCVGCLLEPATLPTQLYTAVLYLATTVVLVIQTMYYDYFRKWRKQQGEEEMSNAEDVHKPLRPQEQTDAGIPIPKSKSSWEPYYYTSARSMAGSTTPPIRSHLWPVKSGPSALGVENDSSSSDDEANPVSRSNPQPVPRPARYGAFLATSAILPRESTARKLLQEPGSGGAFGQALGWMMAAIYMGGRLPQIWLNIKRGSVEGLNPLMFVFATIANGTYVASILARSTEWDKIKANMPWLLDAVACVVLDLFIIFQYVYYRYFQGRGRCNEEDEDSEYVEAKG